MTVTVDDVRYVVGRHFQIPKDVMLSDTRQMRVARPRQIAMALAREMTAASFPTIGRSFGGRDHTTVLHAKARVAKLAAENPHLVALMDCLRDQIRLQDALKPRLLKVG